MCVGACVCTEWRKKALDDWISASRVKTIGNITHLSTFVFQVKVRQYPWGTIQIENEDHCDFVKLREMLVRTNMEDLREKTHDVHYETYRYIDEMR